MNRALILLAVLLVASMTAARATAAESKAEQAATFIQQVAEHWLADGWGANGSARYLRDIEDATWRKRFAAFQQLVRIGKPAVKPLVASLKHDNVEVRIFAAQVLGYLSPHSRSAEPALLEALETDASAAVRLYAADSLGMMGSGKRLKKKLTELRASEKNRDVKKHLGYVLAREANPIAPAVIKQMKAWEAPKDVAKVGEPAPDFELAALNGKPVKLSSYRGKSPVILIFLYGDT